MCHYLNLFLAYWIQGSVFCWVFQLFCIYVYTLDITVLSYDNWKHVSIKIVLFFFFNQKSQQQKQKKGKWYLKCYWENAE